MRNIQLAIKGGKLDDVPPTIGLNGAGQNVNNLGWTYKELIAFNPETYGFFATAYWEYLESGQALTFASGQGKFIL